MNLDEIISIWNSINKIELFAAIFGIISIYFVIKEKVIAFPIGIISVAIYVYIFFDVKLYADMFLQIMFIIFQFYSWYKWLYGGENKSKEKISKCSQKTNLVLIASTIITTFIFNFILQKYTDASIPLVDSLQTSMSLSAQYMTAKKYIENWFWWCVINIISIGMYVYKELYFTSVLFFVYLILAILGYVSWKKKYVVPNF